MSSVVHMLYGFYIFSIAVASDLSQALGECFRPNANVVMKEVLSKESNLDGLPPIVLVHGIFGFGKGVSDAMILSYHIHMHKHLFMQFMHLFDMGCLRLSFSDFFFFFPFFSALGRG